MHVVLFSNQGTALAAAGRVLLGTRAPEPVTNDRVWVAPRVFETLGLQEPERVKGGEERYWLARGPGRKAERVGHPPSTRRELWAHCSELLGDAPWVLREWWGSHGSIVIALLTRDDALASELASGVARAEPSAFVRQHRADSDFDSVFRSLCFDADDHEGDEAWDLGERDGVAPLTALYEAPETRLLGEEDEEEDDDYELDPSDPEERAILRVREDLKASLALPELAREGRFSVRRFETLDLHTRLWRLADQDESPSLFACSGRCDPQAVLRAALTWLDGSNDPPGARALVQTGSDWVYGLEYGGGSDEYWGWLHFASPERCAEVAAALEAQDRLSSLF